MQSQSFLLFFSVLSLASLFTIQGFEPSPAPVSGNDAGSLVPGGYQVGELSPLPAPMMNGEGEEGDPGTVGEEGRGEIPGAEEEEGSAVVWWCTVRDEYDECQNLVIALKETYGYTWKCKDTTQQCLESIKNGEADVISLEAGMAYTAFTSYSMKAIANEVYCDQAESYTAVAIVNRKACHDNMVSLADFKGHRSCHGGYSTASGWNYPIHRIKTLFNSEEMNDEGIAVGFFSKVCAPSEFEGSGVCSGCGTDQNGSCHFESSGWLYYGQSGAFRCLVDELGDIAFVREDTALLYSMEGPRNQTWSTKSVRDFMYLCPDGGCREINGYPGSCSFGGVPANVIMASNSLSNDKRLLILRTLTNATWQDALHRTKSSNINQLLSPSTQQLAAVKKLTRSYLGVSASVSQSIKEMNTPTVEAVPSILNPDSELSSSSSLQYPEIITFFWAVTVLMFMAIAT